MLPKLTLRIKLVGYLRNNFGAVVIRNICFASRFASEAMGNSADSPFAQIVYVLQSLVPGIWQNPLPLTGPAHGHTVDTKHKTITSVNRKILLFM